jgi:hypothetical protein
MTTSLVQYRESSLLLRSNSPRRANSSPIGLGCGCGLVVLLPRNVFLGDQLLKTAQVGIALLGIRLGLEQRGFGSFQVLFRRTHSGFRVAKSSFIPGSNGRGNRICSYNGDS